VPLVWVAWPRDRTVVAHRPARAPVIDHEGDLLDGGAVLPGFYLLVADIFA